MEPLQSVLSIDTVYPDLCERGLLDAASVLEGDLEITSSTRRNRNIVVKSKQRSLLIKQPEADSAAAETVRREILFYRLFGSAPLLPHLTTLLPHLAFAEDAEGLLGLDLLVDAVPVWRHYEACGPDRFPVAVSAAVGGALARAHEDLARPEAIAAAHAAGFPRLPPASLELAWPRPASRASMSLGALELLRRVQEEESLIAALTKIERSWQATAVIHGDIKLDNILLDDRNGEMRIHFVDWELVQIGDPAWDTGGALRDFIFFWVISMPGEATVEAMADKARFPLDILQPAIAAFWQGYSNDSPAPAIAVEALLDRAIGFSAVRMIQTALDMAGGFPDVPAPADLLLRVAVNLAADMARGRTDLYGLPAAATA